MQFHHTAGAAMMLGLTPETLRSWRRRGIGPTYMRFPGGNVRSRGGKRIEFLGRSMRIGRGDEHWCATKPHGTILYPEEKLKAFVEARLVPRGRPFLPRPFPGRLPGGRNHTAAPGERAGAVLRRKCVEDLQLYNTVTAAWLLGVVPETLRSWRRRGIGPAYVRFPGGHARRGKAESGHICYPAEELRAFLKAWLVRYARLPRPLPERNPGPHRARDNLSKVASNERNPA
jgi:hypothetical protein